MIRIRLLPSWSDDDALPMTHILSYGLTLDNMLTNPDSYMEGSFARPSRTAPKIPLDGMDLPKILTSAQPASD
jgi:hypothetical protein